MESAAFAETYGQVLSDYLRTRSEDSLYRASLLSQTFVERGVGPEEIIAFHFEELEKALEPMTVREQARSIGDAHQFLMEVMIAYGVKYKEFLELRMAESLRESEQRAAIERRQAEERERLDREKVEVLGRIAHELRTPITAAMGTLDLARRSLARGQTERLEPLIGSAREAVDRLSRLSAALVQISRGELPELVREPQELDELLAQACSWAMAAAREKQVRFECVQLEPAVVLGDADALLSIFGNLLSNAVRYTPPGGSVTVRQGIAGADVWVEVRDTGMGMTPEAKEHIFERFYRAPEARLHDAQGLGLGLALVHEFVTAHQGRIEVESELGSGSTFRVILPLASDGDVTRLGGVEPNGREPRSTDDAISR